jgi:hypothetical protein
VDAQIVLDQNDGVGVLSSVRWGAGRMVRVSFASSILGKAPGVRLPQSSGTPPAQELETNFDEFSACSDAEAVSGGVVRVSVLVAPQGVLRIVHMTNNRHRDHSDGCADD